MSTSEGRRREVLGLSAKYDFLIFEGEYVYLSSNLFLSLKLILIGRRFSENRRPVPLSLLR